MEEKVNSVIVDNGGKVYCRGAECPVARWYCDNCAGCPVDMLFIVAMQHGIDLQTTLNKERKEQENGKTESN